MSKPRVIVTRRWPQACEQRMQNEFDVVLNESDQPFSQEQYQAALREADALFPTVTDPLNAELSSIGPYINP